MSKLAEESPILPGEGEKLGHLEGQAYKYKQKVSYRQGGEKHIGGALANLTLHCQEDENVACQAKAEGEGVYKEWW